MFIALGQGQTTPWGQIFSFTHLARQLSHFLHVSPINDFVTVFPIQMYRSRSNFVELESLSFKIIGHLVLKKIFTGFYYIWVWRPSWSCFFFYSV